MNSRLIVEPALGERKYLTPEERKALLKATEAAPRGTDSWCAARLYRLPDIGSPRVDRRYCRHATPKGLPHEFGIKAPLSGVPLNLVQKLPGYAALSRTAMYADSLGSDARQFAERMCR